MENKNNIAVFIDGFNFYHAICQHMKEIAYTSNLKWLDYDKLVKDLIIKKRNYDDLEINFYTAVNTFKLDNNGKPHPSNAHHKIFSEALKKRNINVIEGKFKLRSEKLNCYLDCPTCQHPFFVHKFKMGADKTITCLCGEDIALEKLTHFKKVEEKKTDVKIAVDIINAARDKKFNRLYLFSTDSDFVPVAEYIKHNCPEVEFYIVAPSDRRTIKIDQGGSIITKSEYRYGTKDFEDLGVKVLRIKISKFRHCLFPDTFENLRNPWIRA